VAITVSFGSLVYDAQPPVVSIWLGFWLSLPWAR
jgi:hypothetical protein